MPKKPCPFCGELLSPGWSDHRCPEVDEAMQELRASAGASDDESDQIDGTRP